MNDQHSEQDSQDNQTKSHKVPEQGNPIEPTQVKPSQAEKYKTSSGNGNWPKVLAIASAVANLGLLVLGIIGAWFIYKQLRVMEESNQLTRDTLIESQRQFNLQRQDDTVAAKEERERAAI